MMEGVVVVLHVLVVVVGVGEKVVVVCEYVGGGEVAFGEEDPGRSSMRVSQQRRIDGDGCRLGIDKVCILKIAARPVLLGKPEEWHHIRG